MMLTELLTPERVLLPVTARDKRGVIRELAALLVAQSGGDLAEVIEAVQEREDVLSTGIGHSIAIPHGRTPTVRQLGVVCGLSPAPIAFESIDGEPVRLIFLVVGPESSAGPHIKLLGRIVRLVRREPLRQRLLAARTPAELYDTLLNAEVR